MLLPITNLNENRYVGLRALWVLPCTSISHLGFNNDGKLVAVVRSDDWKEIEFELYTAFLIQEKKRVGNGSVILQKIYFEQFGISPESLQSLNKLNESGCVNVVAQDSNGMYHYCGISRGMDSTQWHQQDMRTGEGKVHTSTSDANTPSVVAATIECTTHNYAPFCDNPLTMPTTANIIYFTQNFAFSTPNGSVFGLA
jgi:hypothetical protein